FRCLTHSLILLLSSIFPPYSLLPPLHPFPTRRSSDLTLRSYSPGGVLNALAAALRGGNPLTLSTHRLRRGLPGYLILFDPHAFAHQRQLQTRKSPSPLVFLHISAHFTATHGIPLSS